MYVGPLVPSLEAALQQQGYYQGEVDGLLGPQTRAPITDYQRSNGLPETAAIDPSQRRNH